MLCIVIGLAAVVASACNISDGSRDENCAGRSSFNNSTVVDLVVVFPANAKRSEISDYVNLVVFNKTKVAKAYYNLIDSISADYATNLILINVICDSGEDVIDDLAEYLNSLDPGVKIRRNISLAELN